MCKPKLHREYDEETGKLIKLECGICHEIKTADCFRKNKSKKMVFKVSVNNVVVK